MCTCMCKLQFLPLYMLHMHVLVGECMLCMFVLHLCHICVTFVHICVTFVHICVTFVLHLCHVCVIFVHICVTFVSHLCTFVHASLMIPAPNTLTGFLFR